MAHAAASSTAHGTPDSASDSAEADSRAGKAAPKTLSPKLAIDDTDLAPEEVATLTVTVPKPKKARSVVVQEQRGANENFMTISSFSRVPVKFKTKTVTRKDGTTATKKVPAKSTRLKTKTPASGLGEVRYRAVVTRKNGDVQTTPIVSAFMYQWINDSTAVMPQQTGEAKRSESFVMDGEERNGWRFAAPQADETFSTRGYCMGFRGEFGVADDSRRGDTSSVTLSSDRDLYATVPNLSRDTIDTYTFIYSPYTTGVRFDAIPEVGKATVTIASPQWLCRVGSIPES